MKNRISLYVLLAIWLLMWATGLYFAPELPDQMASHWNSEGVADGFMGKTAAIAFLPLLSIVFFFIHLIIPLADPEKFSKPAFKKYFNLFSISMMVFMYAIYLYSILWNLGYQIDINKIIPILLSGLMYIIALMVRNTEPNLPSGKNVQPERVEAFQKKVSMAFKITAICVLSGFFFPDYFLWLLLAPIIITTVYTIIAAIRI